MIGVTNRAGKRPWNRRPTWLAAVAVAVFLATSPATSLATRATPTHSPIPAQNPQPGGARLELVQQRFATDPNGDIELRYILTGITGDPFLLVPPTSEPPPPEPTPPLAGDPDAPPGSEPVPVPAPEAVVVDLPMLTIRVVNYGPLEDPDDVAGLVGSELEPDAFDELGDAVDGVEIDARPLMTRNDDASVDISLDIGTDVVDSVETRLKLERPGIHPLRVQLLLGDPAANVVVATAGTVIQRLAGAVDADVDVPPPIDLSVVSVTPDPPLTADDETVDLARARVDLAIELAASIGSPVTLEVPPTLIADIAAAPGGSERLSNALAGDEFVALPTVPLDVSSAVAVGRGEAYTRLLAAGESLLTQAVPSTPSRRDVWIATDPLSSAGAQHLRDLGTRFVVIPASLYEDSISDDLPPSDQFVEAELPDGGTLPFLIVDPLASQLSTEAADEILARSTPIEWGVATLAAMLVEQAEDDSIAESYASAPGRTSTPPRRSRILTTLDLAGPDARLISAMEQLTETTPAIRFSAASALTGVTDVLLDDGEPVTIQLPDVAGPSLEARIELLDRVGLQLASAASMLPDDDPRTDVWSERLDTLFSTGYSDAEADATAAEIVAEADTLKQAVQLPEPFTFTLTGRSGTIQVGITNTLDEPLDVVVSFDSNKVTFPQGDQRLTLRPLDETSVVVPVEAEANGTSSISLVVSTPAGEALGEPVTLTARVTALTGLGQVLTGSLVLVLLTWWFTHWRSRRRAALAGDGRERHPSIGKVESDTL